MSHFRKLTSCFIILFINSFLFGQLEDFRENYEDGSIKIAGKYKTRNGFGDTRLDRIYEQNNMMGEWKYYLPNGQVWLVGSYENSQPIGEWVARYENGNVCARGSYGSFPGETNASIGTWTFYWKDGDVASTYVISEDSKNYTPKIVNSRHWSSKEKNSDGSYGEGQMTINHRIFSNDYGRAIVNFPKSAQLFVGMKEKYIHSATNKGICTETKHDFWTEYYPAGGIKSSGKYNWLTNEPYGEWSYYDESTHKLVRKAMIYEDVSRGEVWYWFYDNDSIKQQSATYAGRLYGYTNFFYPNGKRKASGVYKGYNLDGALKNGVWRYYYDNGSIKMIETYYKGTVNGITKEYFDNGQLRMETEFYQGKIVKHKSQYLPDGTQILEDGNGEYRVYRSNGKLEMKATYFDGKRDGTAT